MEILYFSVTDELKTVKHNPNVSNWTLDDGYTQSKPIENEFPYRSYSVHGKRSFISYLYSKKEDLYNNTQDRNGFWMSLTIPGETTRQYLLYEIEILKSIKMHIRPKVIITSDALGHYPPNFRRCFFNSERQLHFYKNYNQNNCEFECMANFTKQECGCVPFYMPSKYEFIFLWQCT